MINKSLIATLKKQAQDLEKLRQSRRFRRVIGILHKQGLIYGNYEIEKHADPLPLEDFLWAGKIEPRVLALLPALVLKKPSLFLDLKKLPPDLAKILHGVRRGQNPASFRGIPPDEYLHWIPRVGHRGKRPSLMKTFRFTVEDLEILHELQSCGMKEVDAVRQGLRLLRNKLQI